MTLDADMNIVLHIQNKNTETVKVSRKKAALSEDKVYTLTNLTLEPKSE